MKRNKLLKIGGHTFTVVYQPETELSDGDSCGACDRNTNTIYINSVLSESQQEATLIHEILHAINWELQEEILESIAQQMYQVLKDNKFTFD